jgi:uncharacterized protein YdaU (DUF1376 family)
MAKNPIFPLYYNDIDRSTRDWTDEEFGCYVRLLLHQWDKFGLPLGFDRLSRISTSVEKNWELIGPKFEQVDGVLKNSNLERIRGERFKDSEKQSLNGSKGGRPSKNKNPDETQNKPKINPEQKPKKSLHNEYESEYGISDSDINDLLDTSTYIPAANVFLPVYEKMMEVFMLKFSGYFREDGKEMIACQIIAGKIEKVKGWEARSSLNGHLDEMLAFWGELVDYIAGDTFLRKMELTYHSTKGWQRLGQHMAKQEGEDVGKSGKKDETEGMSDYQKDLYKKREAARNKKS